MCIHYLGFTLLSWDSMTKSNFGLQLHLTGYHWRHSGQELKVETMGECHALACSSWISQLAFLHSLDQLLRGDTFHNGLGPFSSINQEKKCPYRLPYSPSGWKSFLSWSSIIQNGSTLCQTEVNIASITDLSVWHTNTSLLNYNLSAVVHPQDLILVLELQYKTSQLLNVFKNPTSLKVQSL